MNVQKYALLSDIWSGKNWKFESELAILNTTKEHNEEK